MNVAVPLVSLVRRQRHVRGLETELDAISQQLVDHGVAIGHRDKSGLFARLFFQRSEFGGRNAAGIFDLAVGVGPHFHERILVENEIHQTFPGVELLCDGEGFGCSGFDQGREPFVRDFFPQQSLIIKVALKAILHLRFGQAVEMRDWSRKLGKDVRRLCGHLTIRRIIRLSQTWRQRT